MKTIPQMLYRTLVVSTILAIAHPNAPLTRKYNLKYAAAGPGITSQRDTVTELTDTLRANSA